MKAAKFYAQLRGNRQMTLPKENLDAIAQHLHQTTSSLYGCVLELNISAIRYKNITYRLSSTDERETKKE